MILSLFFGKAGRRLVSFALTIILCMSAASFATDALPVSVNSDTTRQGINNVKIIRLINAYRVENGFVTLRQNPKLGMSTGFKIKDMVSQSYFAHTNPEGSPFSANVRRAKYEYRSVAEVLAKGCRNEAQVLRLWAKSPTHNDALLDPAFLDINCSSYYSHGLTYVACHLARPKMLAMTSRY